jgi:hypothetical protein
MSDIILINDKEGVKLDEYNGTFALVSCRNEKLSRSEPASDRLKRVVKWFFKL